MACKGKQKGRRIALVIISSLLFSQLAFAEEIQSPVQEIQSPVQEVLIDNSYLTKAHIQTNSKIEAQTIKIQKSFLVWVTIRKGKDNPPTINTTR